MRGSDPVGRRHHDPEVTARTDLLGASYRRDSTRVTPPPVGAGGRAQQASQVGVFLERGQDFHEQWGQGWTPCLEIAREREPGQFSVDLVVLGVMKVRFAIARAHSTPSGASTPGRDSRLAVPRLHHQRVAGLL